MGILAKEVDGSRKTIQNNAAKVDSIQAALRASKLQLLDYNDRQAILKGARAQKIKQAEHDLLFFTDYSKDTTTK
ncbi:hypothetical protein DPEC_G00155180 [Dallia pectoralis]|uniref:Uncharacterized protein n=1 Tax=Dallia pectoralis TaxID=75939 RepID=A0ACC2GKE2_DALPE|nr:hypothetical protein DPEC_G00155180 [Dallia pectoralis]